MISRFLSRRVLYADRFLYATPDRLGLVAEDVEFSSEGGRKLRGWFFWGTKRGTVVFCPGNSGNVSSHLEYIRLALGTGYSVLAFDYRGFGRSDGEADLCSVVRDVEAACAFITSHTRGPYALFGLSLGAGAALAAAGRAAEGAVGVVIEGVYDMFEMLRGLFAEGYFGPVRVRAVAGLTGSLAERSRRRLVRMRLPSPLARLLATLATAGIPFEGKSPASLAARLGTKPVLLVHGVRDELLPFEASIDLHQTLPGRRRLWLVPETGHPQEPALARGLEYTAQLGDFLDCAISGTPLDTPVVRVSDVPARHPAMGGVHVRLGVDTSAATSQPQGPVLASVMGGGILRQVLLDGSEDTVLEFPGPIQSVFTLRVLRPETDPTADGYMGGGYQTVFRAMVEAVNTRDLTSLDVALEAHMRLGRCGLFDFFAALYCLRAAQAALGGVPGWPRRDHVFARRNLQRFLVLWDSNPALPGAHVAESPARWVREQLDKMK
ncbi:MAG: alpha/beta hydrolase [Candidatus Methylomirabilota bacterium]